MDKIIEQIDAMIAHVFNMPKSSDTDMILAGLQDLRNMVAAQPSVQSDVCPTCDGATVVLSSFGGIEDCVECGGTGKRR